MNKPTSQEINLSDRKYSRVLNIKLLFGTFIVLALLSPALYFWNNYQTNRSAHSFLERAEQLETKGDFRAAADYLNRYVLLNPSDGDARLRLAKDYDQSAKDPQSKERATELYYQALGLISAEKVPAAHLRIAELRLETGEYTSAANEAEQIVVHSEKRFNLNTQDQQAISQLAQAKRLLSLALYRQHLTGATIDIKGYENSLGKLIADALNLNSGDQELSQILAHIYRDEPQLLSQEGQSLSKAERESKADQIMDEMIKVHEKDPSALLARYTYRIQYQLPGAADDLAAACNAAPENLNVMLTKAADEQTKALQLFRDKSRLENARAHFDKAVEIYLAAIKLAPDDDRAYANLGDIYFIQGDSDKAISICKQGLEKVGDSIRLNYLLAKIFLAQGQTEEAAKTDKTGRDGPIDVLEKLTERLTAANAGSEAARHDKIFLEQNVSLLRAEWFIQRRQHLEALPLLKKVVVGDNIALGGNTNVIQAWTYLGECYSVMNQWDQAAAAFDEAAASNPQSLQSHKSAAQAWAYLGRFDLSTRHCEQALGIDNTDPDTKLLLAMNIIQIELVKPKTERNWDAIENALSKAQESPADSPLKNAVSLKLLEAEFILFREFDREDRKSAIQKAADKVREAEAEISLNSPQMLDIILVYEQLGCNTDADRLLKEYDKVGDRSAKYLIIRSRLASSRTDKENAYQILQTGISNANPAEKQMLQKELIHQLIFENRLDDARHELLLLLKNNEPISGKPVDPAILELISQIAELTLEKQDVKTAAQLEKELQRLEGADGSLWRCCKARRLLAESKGVKDPKISEAEKLQAELVTMRPSWPPAHILNAFILERRGRLELAADEYQAAISLGERRMVVFEKLVLLLYKVGRFSDAEKALRRALQLDPSHSPARRQLAQLLVDRGGEKEWQEALALLNGLPENDRNDPINHFVRAVILAKRGGRENLENAQQIAEMLVNDANGAKPGELLLLARIYEAQGKLPEARQRCLEIVNQPSAATASLAVYIDMLLRHNLPEEVEPWLIKLEKATPDNLDAMALRVRWLNSQGRNKEIEPLVEKMAESLSDKYQNNSQDAANLCLRIGNIYSAVKMHLSAEKWYRRTHEKDVDIYEPLAMSLAQQGKTNDAIRLCMEASNRDTSIRPLLTLVTILDAGNPTNEDFELVESLLLKVKESSGTNPDILSSVANVRILQQRFTEAADLYREILKLRPKDVLTMNNLATALAEQSSGLSEGMQYVEQAIAIAGPQSGLLDTKGMILVFTGKAEEAVPLLEMAAAAPNADPRYYFHLAVAYLRTGNLEKARDALKRATDGNLTDQILTPSDKKLLVELEQSLKQT